MSKKCQKSDDWLVIWSLSGRLVKRNTCHLLIRSLIAGIWTFGCRTSWSLVYVRLKIMHGIERIMAPSTHVCSLPDFYLGMDLHGKCEESCVDWKGWLKVLEAYTHHRAANQLQKPILRQIVDRLPFWTRSAQRLAWVADISSYMEGHRRHVLRHGTQRNICVWCHLIGACCCLHWSQPSHREAVPDCALTCSALHHTCNEYQN